MPCTTPQKLMFINHSRVVVGHVLDVGDQGHAVVDDQVDRAVVCDHPVGPCMHRPPVGDVEQLRGDLDAAALAQGDRLGQPHLVDVGQREAVPRRARLDGRDRPMPDPAPVTAAARPCRTFTLDAPSCGRDIIPRQTT